MLFNAEVGADRPAAEDLVAEGAKEFDQTAPDRLE